jgi:hypothetical protein
LLLLLGSLSLLSSSWEDKARSADITSFSFEISLDGKSLSLSQDEKVSRRFTLARPSLILLRTETDEEELGEVVGGEEAPSCDETDLHDDNMVVLVYSYS